MDLQEQRGIVDLYSRNVAVDHLDEDQGPVISHDVESLSLHIGVLVGLPFQVLLGEDSVRGFGSLLSDRLNGFRAVDRFLRAHRRGETGSWISFTATTECQSRRTST